VEIFDRNEMIHRLGWQDALPKARIFLLHRSRDIFSNSASPLSRFSSSSSSWINFIRFDSHFQRMKQEGPGLGLGPGSLLC